MALEYVGTTSLVSVELWERVQGVMGGRFAKKRRRMTHDFAFSGLIACSRCGCSVVGEIKKQRYVYYHCTGYADKCQGNPASCRRKHVREEALEAQFTELLGRLRFDDEVLAWVREALHASHADQRREHQAAIEPAPGRAPSASAIASAPCTSISSTDKIGGDFYDQMAGEWREEQHRLQREIDRHEAAEQSYMDEGVQILELAQNAQRLFEQQEPRQKRRLLNFLLSNCSWEDGEVIATFRQPFDLLAETTAIVARHSAGDTANSAKRENWLVGAVLFGISAIRVQAQRGLVQPRRDTIGRLASSAVMASRGPDDPVTALKAWCLGEWLCASSTRSRCSSRSRRRWGRRLRNLLRIRLMADRTFAR